MRNKGKLQIAVGSRRAGGSLAGPRQRPAQPLTRRPDGPARSSLRPLRLGLRCFLGTKIECNNSSGRVLYFPVHGWL